MIRPPPESAMIVALVFGMLAVATFLVFKTAEVPIAILPPAAVATSVSDHKIMSPVLVVSVLLSETEMSSLVLTSMSKPSPVTVMFALAVALLPII